MGRILREPTLHFALLGLALFLLFAMVGDKDDKTIVVSESTVQCLRLDFVQQHGVEATAVEEEQLVHRFVQQEVLYREALSLSLDQGDPIVKQRMAQKMGFVAQDLASIPPPTAEELEAFLESNAKRYRRPAKLALTQSDQSKPESSPGSKRPKAP